MGSSSAELFSASDGELSSTNRGSSDSASMLTGSSMSFTASIQCARLLVDVWPFAQEHLVGVDSFTRFIEILRRLND